MKKYFYYLCIFCALGAVFFLQLRRKPKAERTFNAHVNLVFPCARPIEYAIGTVDPGFALSESQFLQIAKEAEKIWETPSSKELFAYNPKAEFKLNLIFDERQIQANEAEKMQDDLAKLKEDQEKITNQYTSLNVAYEQKVTKFNADVAEYQKRLDEYNEKVLYWNSKGGAPKDEYDDLKKEKKMLDKMFGEIEEARDEINKLAGKANNLVGEENKIVDKYNSNVSTYRSKFGKVREFEKGIYDGQAINIYQFNQIADLRLTLAHEFGHSLGIDHLNRPESVMYYLMGDQNMENPKLTDEDWQALKEVCRLN